MRERTTSNDLWRKSPSIQGVLNVTASTLERFSIPSPSVEFATSSQLVEKYGQRLEETDAAFRVLREKGISSIIDNAENSSGILGPDSEGNHIYLSAEYFNQAFVPAYDKRDYEMLCANSTILFAVITRIALQGAAQEVELSRDPELVFLYKQKLIEGLRSLQDAEPLKAPEVETVIEELSCILTDNPNLRLVARGVRVNLMDDKYNYTTEFASKDEEATSFIEQYLRNYYIREMKKKPWFIAPEKWRAEVKSWYKNTQVVKTPPNIEQFFNDYLSGELAKKALEKELEELKSTKEISVEPQELIDIQEKDIEQGAMNASQEVPLETTKGKKKQKVSKKKLYPNQKQKLMEAAKKQTEIDIASDGMRVVNAYFEIPKQELYSTIAKSYFAKRKRINNP